MYSVVIIDDEMMIREGIKTIIDWSSYGFTIDGEASDSVSGIELVLKLKPKLILADIRMPGQSGIEMVRSLREKGYKGEVIILTGYAEFEYAKEAIGLGVASYLLKPIEEEELCETLEVVKQKLDSREAVDVMFNSQIALKRIESFQRLIYESSYTDLDLIQYSADPFFDLKSHYHVICIQKEPNYCDVMDRLLTNYINKNNNGIFFVSEECIVFITRDKTFRQLEIVLNDLIRRYKEQTGESCFIAVGGQSNGYLKVKKSFQQSKGLYGRRSLFRNQWIVFYDAYVKDDNEEGMQGFDGQYVLGLIEIGNNKAIEVYLSRLEEQFIISDYPVEKIKGICVNGLIEIKEKISFSYKSLAKNYPENNEILDRVYGYNKLSAIMTYMLQVFTDISDTICYGSNDSTMKRILNYIHSNYDKNLKLESLARLFNYNSSYLGKMFKDKMQLSFNNYLDVIRIEHAKELLETGEYKIYEVAEKVGYCSVDYFYSKFKKHVQVSPKNYKKQCMNQEKVVG